MANKEQQMIKQFYKKQEKEKIKKLKDNCDTGIRHPLKK